MKLLLIRHAVAEDQDEFARTGLPDDERPLTKDGRKEMRDAARGLAQIVKHIDSIATSPLVRAVQTADLVADEIEHDARETTHAMKPDAPYSAMIEWLGVNRTRELVAAVGHNPHISALACVLIGARDGAIDMKKGASLLVEFTGEPGEGNGVLLWYLKPGQMRKLG